MKTRIKMGMLVAVTFVSLLTGLVAGSYFSTVSAAEKPLKIGTIMPTAATFAVYTKGVLGGLELAVDEINASGGVLGRKVEYKVRDTQFKPDVGVREARFLILEEKVDMINGPMSSSVLLAVSEVTREHKMLHLVWSSKHTDFTEARFNPYGFRFCDNVTVQARQGVRGMIGQGWKTAWLISPDYSWGQEMAGEVKAFAAKVVPEVKFIGESWPPMAEKDYTPYITEIAAKKPDVIYCNVFGGDFVVFIQQLDRFGLLDKLKICGVLLDGEQVRPLGLGKIPEGIHGYSQYEPFTPDIPANRAWRDKYRSKTGDYPGYTATNVYITMMFWKAAMEKARTTTDRDAIIRALEGMSLMTPLGQVTIRAFDHQSDQGHVVGVTARDPRTPNYLVVKGKYMPATDILHTIDEINAIRSKAAGGK